MSPYKPEVRGYSPMDTEPRTAAGYEPETIYEASVETGDRIYFMFSCREGVKRVSIMRSDAPDDWTNYTFGIATEIHHIVPNGIWIMRLNPGVNPVWLFKASTKVKKGLVYSPTISKANDPETLAQKNYREMKAEEEVKKTIKWYEKAKKEVKGKMYLQLIDVTIFNRKTKHVDFREDIIAENNDEAYLLAVQAFGKYDPKVHVKAAKCILGFNEIGDKVEE